MIANDYDHPENILVRKGVPLNKVYAISFAERSALAIGNKKQT